MSAAAFPLLLMASVGLVSLLLIISVAYKVVAFVLKRKLRATLTAVDDVPLLGLSRKEGRKIPGTAVICGGSIAGLLSARVCSDHFENVVIVEPEAWLNTEEGKNDHHRDPAFSGRARVAQYTSMHVFQSFTLIALRKLFPDFEREVRRGGARILPADTSAHYSGFLLPAPYHQYPNGILPNTMFITRPGYETILRRLVLETCANVKCLTGCISALIPESSSSSTIASVAIRDLQGTQTEIPSAIVVDCTGPTNGGLRWLQNSKFDNESYSEGNRCSSRLQDLKITYDPKMAYTTCEFDVPSTLIPKLQAIGFPGDYETAGNLYVYIADPKKDRRTLIITRREGNHLQIAAGGWNIRERLGNVSDIKSMLSDIVSDHPLPEWISAMLDIFQEEDVPATYIYDRIPPSVYVQYYRAAHLPSNFVALGDSVLQLNPVRGQGCTKACVDAVTLNTLLAQCATVTSAGSPTLPSNFSRNYFAVQSNRTGQLWDTLKADDYSWTSTTPAPGDDPVSCGAWRRAYSAQVMQLALHDREVAAVLWHITNWLAPATDLLSPWILGKVAWRLLRVSVGI